MARCGRCGMWSEYPEAHKEKNAAGVCIWYQIRLQEDQVFEHRECKDFFEKIPGFHAMDHFDYKIKRDNIGDAYTHAKRAKVLAYIGLVLSIVGLLLRFIS